jgi:hypothetical protein
MTGRRYIATVEHVDGEYWISFPGIEKAGSHAKRPEDIVPHARAFLSDWTQYGSPPPASLDDAVDSGEGIAPFEGVKLVIFEWEPPPSTGYRVVGYEGEELLFDIQVPAEKIAQALVLAGVPETDPGMSSPYPLTREAALEICGTPMLPGFAYFLEADR